MAIIQLGCSKLSNILRSFYCAPSAPQEQLKQGSESPAEMIFLTGVHVKWDPFSLRVLFSLKVHFFCILAVNQVAMSSTSSSPVLDNLDAFSCTVHLLANGGQLPY